MGVTITPQVGKESTVFQYKIAQCPGVEDEAGSIEVRYDQISQLQSLPDIQSGQVTEQSVSKFKMPGGETVGFVIATWRESVAGRMFDLKGPFIVQDAS